jgi:carbon monoxide dehydrogenase subunit G
MAVTMTGAVSLPAERNKVWEALLDPEVLAKAIPGCEELEKKSDTDYAAKVKIAVGPIKARFSGTVTLSDMDAPNGCTISGEGQGGIAGFAKGGAKIRLEDAPEGGTLLSYDVEANVGGKLAQLGGRLIDSVAKKFADQFFNNFAKELSPAPAES